MIRRVRCSHPRLGYTMLRQTLAGLCGDGESSFLIGFGGTLSGADRF
jgi:hypothetical protein